MIDEKYICRIRNVLKVYLAEDDRAFLYGSSVRGKNFSDVDVAIVSDRDHPDKEKTVRAVKRAFEESTLPYKFDVVDFKSADKTFCARVLERKKIWVI